jgi:CDP-glycerol glycerophosphotransferase
VAKSLSQSSRSRGRQLISRTRSLLRGTSAGDRPPDVDTTVSVVVPACEHDVEFFDEALAGLRAQQHDALEIIVVPHRRPGRIPSLAAQHAKADDRVIVLDAVDGTREAAFDVGARQATGRYLAFVKASDVVPPAGLRRLVRSLEVTDSDFALGGLTEAATVPDGRAKALRLRLPPVQRARLVDVPAAIGDTHPGNKLFTAAFWKRADLAFTASDGRGPLQPVVEAFLETAAFDVVGDVTYRDMNRGHGTPIGHLRSSISDLPRWLEGQRRTLELLRETAQEVRTAWVVNVLEREAPRYIDDGERADDVAWSALRDHVHQLAESGGDTLWRDLSADASVRTWLLLQDHRAALHRLSAWARVERGFRRTDVREGKVFAELPFYRDTDLGVPDECYEMSPDETRLTTVLSGVRWTDDRTLQLTLFSYIPYVDYAGTPPEVSVSLVEEGTGVAQPLPVAQFDDGLGSATVAHRDQDYSPGGCEVSVDAAALARAARSAASRGVDDPSWRLDIQVATQGVSRRGTLTEVDQRGTAGGLGTAALAPVVVDGRRIVLERDPQVMLRITTADLAPVRLRSATVTGREVSGEIDSEVPVLSVLAWQPASGTRLEAPVAHGAFVLRLPEVGFAGGLSEARHWRVRAVTSDGEVPVGWPSQEHSRWIGATPVAEVVLNRSASGNCEVSEATRTALLHEVRVADGHISLRGDWLGVPPESWRLLLRGPRGDLQASDVSHPAEGGFTATFPTVWDEWGLGPAPIPSGVFRPVLVCDGSERAIESAPLPGESLAGQLLQEYLTTQHRVRVTKPGREVRLGFDAPLADNERGSYWQGRLQEKYGPGADLMIDEQSVYLQSYHGASATDSQLAIARELAATRPDLRLYWGVVDRSAWVPDGVTPLLLRSEEWHKVRATSRYLVSNVDFDRRFVKRPGQRFLQTFHGYPSKSMGVMLWEGKQFTPSMIESELERTSRDWDLILTPTPEMDTYYRCEYRYDGPILSHGYPRDDVLVSPQAAGIRERTRERLGIAADQTVVLYAPTWRDHLATSYRSAPAVRHLDLESASEALGEEFVFLMRGHRFQAPGHGRRRVRAARLLDVTSYPEINDLILAADVAVLDYSSLRFDFALTNRPMMFLVPDLDVYTGGARGFLFDYRDTAPGPLLETADQVVDQLRDLERLAAEHVEAYSRFNATYNYLQDGASAAHVVREFFDPPESGRVAG